MEYVIGFTDYVNLNVENQSQEELLRALVNYYAGPQGTLDNFLKHVSITQANIKEVKIEELNDNDRLNSKEITN